MCSQNTCNAAMGADECVKHASASLCVPVSCSIFRNIVIRQMTFKAGRFVLVAKLL